MRPTQVTCVGQRACVACQRTLARPCQRSARLAHPLLPPPLSAAGDPGRAHHVLPPLKVAQLVLVEQPDATQQYGLWQEEESEGCGTPAGSKCSRAGNPQQTGAVQQQQQLAAPVPQAEVELPPAPPATRVAGSGFDGSTWCPAP